MIRGSRPDDYSSGRGPSVVAEEKSIGIGLKVKPGGLSGGGPQRSHKCESKYQTYKRQHGSKDNN